MADLFTPQTREKKRELYAIAKRWADRLPGERGRAKKQTYALMRAALFRALRA